MTTEQQTEIWTALKVGAWAKTLDTLDDNSTRRAAPR